MKKHQNLLILATITKGPVGYLMNLAEQKSHDIMANEHNMLILPGWGHSVIPVSVKVGTHLHFKLCRK